MTKKEKIAAEMLYSVFQKTGARSTTRSELITNLKNKLSNSDLDEMLTYGHSRYLESRGGTGTIVQITSDGIDYMETKNIRILK